jgi:hypothetical protein
MGGHWRRDPLPQGEFGACAVSAKKPPDRQERRSRISRLKGTPAAVLGTVNAPDEKTALERAAAEFKVPPALRDRLVARPVK